MVIINEKLTLSTNGTLITEKNAAIIGKYVNQVDISLDGYDESTVSKVRGKNVFSKVIKSIKLLQEYTNVKISLSIVIGNKNYTWEEKFRKLCNDLKVESVVRSFEPVGRGKINKTQFVKVLEDKSDKFYQSRFQNREMGACNCKAGQYVRYITYNGDLYPCQSFLYPQFQMGNLLNTYDWEMTEKNRCVIESYKSYNYTMCKTCKVRFFCWPCPGELFRIETNNGQEKIIKTCENVQEILIKKFWK